jgi:hypothetical protein
MCKAVTTDKPLGYIIRNIEALNEVYPLLRVRYTQSRLSGKHYVWVESGEQWKDVDFIASTNAIAIQFYEFFEESLTFLKEDATGIFKDLEPGEYIEITNGIFHIPGKFIPGLTAASLASPTSPTAAKDEMQV